MAIKTQAQLLAEWAGLPVLVNPAAGRDIIDTLFSLTGGPGYIFASSYGVKADNSTDDTAAWTAALTAAQTSSATGTAGTVIAPPGISRISQIAIPAGVTLIGHPNSSYSADNGAAIPLSGGSQLRKISGTTALVVMHGASISNANGVAEQMGSGIVNMGIYGLSKGNPGIIQDATRNGMAFISRCAIVNCSWAYDGNGTSGGGWIIMDNCTIASNGNGVRAVVDSRITNNFIAGNAGDGINLGSGASDTTIIGNKIEFNNGYGVIVDSTDDVLIIGNNFDAAGKAGIRFTNNFNGSITGNVLRRSGFSATAGTVDDCHFYLSGNAKVAMTGNSTRALTFPNYCLAGGANTGVIIVGNALNGYITALNNPTPPTGHTIPAGSNLL